MCERARQRDLHAYASKNPLLFSPSNIDTGSEIEADTVRKNPLQMQISSHVILYLILFFFAFASPFFSPLHSHLWHPCIQKPDSGGSEESTGRSQPHLHFHTISVRVERDSSRGSTHAELRSRHEAGTDIIG